MTQLTRESIVCGAYQECFDNLPEHLRWSRERLEQSMLETLASRPSSDELWLFGYGSLIWNPLFSFSHKQRATLHGWHRSFCQRMMAGRATLEAPGRMLSLEPGGQTIGTAFQVPQAIAKEELLLVWHREMTMGAYRPIWVPLDLDDGRSVESIAFVADAAHPWHEANSGADVVAPIMVSASGPFGSNADYVLRLQRALDDMGASDPYVSSIWAEIQRLKSKYR